MRFPVLSPRRLAAPAAIACAAALIPVASLAAAAARAAHQLGGDPRAVRHLRCTGGSLRSRRGWRPRACRRACGRHWKPSWKPSSSLTPWSTSGGVARPTPLRSLHFGPHDEGLVTFLVYPPDELVQVVRIQWLGE
jgi:hypothetical protein